MGGQTIDRQLIGLHLLIRDEMQLVSRILAVGLLHQVDEGLVAVEGEVEAAVGILFILTDVVTVHREPREVAALFFEVLVEHPDEKGGTELAEITLPLYLYHHVPLRH